MPIKCDLYNPTQAARVIYDGINNSVPIRIAPGETVSGILLAEHVIATLKQSAKIGPNVDLIVTEIQDPDPEPEDRDAFLNQGRPVEDAATAIEAANAREEQDVDVRVNKDGSTIVNAATPKPPEPQKKTTRPPPRPRGR